MSDSESTDGNVHVQELIHFHEQIEVLRQTTEEGGVCEKVMIKSCLQLVSSVIECQNL